MKVLNRIALTLFYVALIFSMLNKLKLNNLLLEFLFISIGVLVFEFLINIAIVVFGLEDVVSRQIFSKDKKE